MFLYTFAVIVMIAFSSILLAFILNKNGMLNLQTILSIAFSSFLICLLVPVIFSAFIGYSDPNGALPAIPMGFVLVLLIIIIVYVTLLLLFTIVVSEFALDKKLVKANYLVKALLRTVTAAGKRVTALRFKPSYSGIDVEALISAKEESLKEASDDKLQYNDNLEKSVDSVQIIDKMGVDIVNAEVDVRSESSDLPEYEVETDYFSNDGYNDDIIEDIIPLNDECLDGIAAASVEEPDNEELEAAACIEAVLPPENDISGNEYMEEAAVSSEELISDSLQADDEVERNGQPESEDTSGSSLEELTVSNDAVVDAALEVAYEDEVYNIIEQEAASFSEDVTQEPVQSVIANEINSDFENINDYIEEAFRLKGTGDLEGAILHYMYALDKGLENEAVFWVILDMCVLYKELGQAEMARDILESYVESYGSVMDAAIKAEIERNLFGT